MQKLDRNVIVRKTFADLKKENGFMSGTMADRISAVWDITKNTWAFVPGGNAEQRLQRHVAVLVRRKG